MALLQRQLERSRLKKVGDALGKPFGFGLLSSEPARQTFHIIKIDGLCQMCIEPHIPGATLVFFLSVACYGDQKCIVEAGFFA